MRTVTFRTHGPVGAYGGRTEAQLDTFLLNIPNLFYFGYVPPCNVVNAVLAVGISDAGMSGGCKWKPFQISSKEYEEVIVALRASDPTARGKAIVFADVPNYVDSKHEWIAWVMYTEAGIPYAEHLRLLENERALYRRDQEEAQGINRELSESIHMQWYRAGTALMEFTRPYLEAYRERKRR
jgi:hypothetical protein